MSVSHLIKDTPRLKGPEPAHGCVAGIIVDHGKGFSLHKELTNVLENQLREGEEGSNEEKAY